MLLKKAALFITCILSFQAYCQNDKVVSWINSNAIKIDNASPDTELSYFKNNAPEKFKNAKIFGFGEASHHGKEFFDIKAKFFKYLVQTQNVKVFIIEDSYTAESGINKWISGGEGDIETIDENFKIVPWKCKEVVNLLKWMREYNLNKTEDQQIRFYGMDIQNVDNINFQIRELVNNYDIPVSEDLLVELDRSTEKKVDYEKTTDWADIQMPKLEEIQSILVNFQSRDSNLNDAEFYSAIRALNYLKKYTYFIQNHYSQDRDLKMFENVKWIVENLSKNSKAFIWAHNEHINYRGFGNYSRRNIYNLGKYLKEYYNDDYYSVGFDFGIGTLGGYVFKKDKSIEWKNYQMSEPYPGSYAKTLVETKDDIYFIDMQMALNDKSINFFNQKAKQIMLGGPGYNPDNVTLFKKKFSEMYDGLIFIKNISVADYGWNSN
ncbi:erythromycin esterase family protein [Croceiramulus getboli]|nr:erythromycin esterase family protein [Flavobacteriaceae bacterium YJPT1-3]